MLANEAIGHVESDIDELSDQMNEMTRRMLRIEEERQVCSLKKKSENLNFFRRLIRQNHCIMRNMKTMNFSSSIHFQVGL